MPERKKILHVRNKFEGGDIKIETEAASPYDYRVEWI